MHGVRDGQQVARVRADHDRWLRADGAVRRHPEQNEYRESRGLEQSPECGFAEAESGHRHRGGEGVGQQHPRSAVVDVGRRVLHGLRAVRDTAATRVASAAATKPRTSLVPRDITRTPIPRELRSYAGVSGGSLGREPHAAASVGA